MTPGIDPAPIVKSCRLGVATQADELPLSSGDSVPASLPGKPSCCARALGQSAGERHPRALGTGVARPNGHAQIRMVRLAQSSLTRRTVFPGRGRGWPPLS